MLSLATTIGTRGYYNAPYLPTYDLLLIQTVGR